MPKRPSLLDQAGGQVGGVRDVEAGVLLHPGHPAQAEGLRLPSRRQEPVTGDDAETDEVRQGHDAKRPAGRAPGGRVRHTGRPTSGTASGPRDMSLVTSAHPNTRPATARGASRTRPVRWASARATRAASRPGTPRHGRLEHHPGVLAEQKGVGGEDQAGERGDDPAGQAADHQVAEEDPHDTEPGVHPAEVEHQVHGRSPQPEQPARRGVAANDPGGWRKNGSPESAGSRPAASIGARSA